MNTIPYVHSQDTITVYLDGKAHQVTSDFPEFQTLKDLIYSDNLNDKDQALNLVQPATIITGLNIGNVVVGHDTITVNGLVVHSYLADLILRMQGQGSDVTPWIKFMDKLYKNPSKTAVNELFLWLERAGMPITPEGNFLAYKKVRSDFSSYHDRNVKNDIGTVVEMPREQVNEDRRVLCSTGLHFCSWHYLPHYRGNEGKVVVLEIDPADVVSIPEDHHNAKGRAWRYKVLREVPEEKAPEIFNGSVVLDTNEDQPEKQGFWPTLGRWLKKVLSA